MPLRVCPSARKNSFEIREVSDGAEQGVGNCVFDVHDPATDAVTLAGESSQLLSLNVLDEQYFPDMLSIVDVTIAHPGDLAVILMLS